MNLQIKFLTDIIKPWEELNLRLGMQHAIQPEISDFTRMAYALSVMIKHFAEPDVKPKNASIESQAYKVISDVADASKHKKLDVDSRNNTLILSSCFEGTDDEKFRFIRNVITINHKSLGKLDFIETARDAILYLIEKLKLNIKWTPIVIEGKDFQDEVLLHLETKYQVSWSGLSIQFLKRNKNGDLVPYDPPKWKFSMVSSNPIFNKGIK